MTGERQPGFAWPPSQPSKSEPPPPPTREPRPRTLAGLAARALAPSMRATAVAIRDTEKYWLEPAALPLARRIADLDWRPDTPAEYCDRCAMPVGPGEGVEFGCANCRGMNPAWQRAVRLGGYEGHLAEWIQEVKFRRAWRLAIDLGRELGRATARLLPPPGKGAPALPLVVVPVPCSYRRRITRGIDHAHHIATGVAAELASPMVHALRRRHSPSQRAVPPSERLTNVRGRIVPRSPIDLTGAHVLLVDDVLTTGSTMGVATRALLGPAKRCLAKERRPERVWACIAAVTPPPGRVGGRPVGGPPLASETA